MYDSYLEAMKHLNDAEFRECVMKIRDYALEGIDKESESPYVNIILAMAKPNLDSARRRYMASVENGKKGFSSSFSNSSNSVLINEANDSERLKEKEERKEPPTEEQPSHTNTSVVGVADKGKGETTLYSKDSSISSAPLDLVDMRLGKLPKDDNLFWQAVNLYSDLYGVSNKKQAAKNVTHMFAEIIKASQ